MESVFNVNISSLTRGGHEVARDVVFGVASGELVVLSGKNGAGKSSVLLAIMGHPSCDVVGEIRLRGEMLVGMPTHERARKGLFLAHQESPTIAGVALGGVVRSAREAVHGKVSIPETQSDLRAALEEIGLDPAFAKRGLNEGFSGGEKKKAEMVQLLLLRPAVALLDEVDSGLDVRAREAVATIIERLRADGTSFVVVTHSVDFKERLKPTKVVTL